jgi:hypothetical protein
VLSRLPKTGVRQGRLVFTSYESILRLILVVAAAGGINVANCAAMPMYEEINHHRRRLLGAAVMSIAAAEHVMVGSADAQSNEINPADATTVKPGTNTSFGSLKQIDAAVLNVGYAEAGTIDGPAVILLHGWPYDIHSFVDVAPLLAAAGYRVIVPHLRGHGTTRLLSSKTFRNGQQSVVALDILALMDALKIEKAILAGYD